MSWHTKTNIGPRAIKRSISRSSGSTISHPRRGWVKDGEEEGSSSALPVRHGLCADILTRTKKRLFFCSLAPRLQLPPQSRRRLGLRRLGLPVATSTQTAIRSTENVNIGRQDRSNYYELPTTMIRWIFIRLGHLLFNGEFNVWELIINSLCGVLNLIRLSADNI